MHDIYYSYTLTKELMYRRERQMIEAYLITLLGVAAAQASPGPNLMAVASTGIGQGRRSALLATLGISTGMLIWALAVSYGLGTLFTTYPLSLIGLKVIGGSYLLWLSFRALKSAVSNDPADIVSDDRAHTAVDSWKHGLLVVLTNPTAALTWSAVATFLFGLGLDTWQVALFGPVGASSGFVIYGCYAVLFSTSAANSFYKRFSRWFESVFSAAFAFIGGKLLFDGLRTLR